MGSACSSQGDAGLADLAGLHLRIHLLRGRLGRALARCIHKGALGAHAGGAANLPEVRLDADGPVEEGHRLGQPTGRRRDGRAPGDDWRGGDRIDHVRRISRYLTCGFCGSWSPTHRTRLVDAVLAKEASSFRGGPWSSKQNSDCVTRVSGPARRGKVHNRMFGSAWTQGGQPAIGPRGPGSAGGIVFAKLSRDATQFRDKAWLRGRRVECFYSSPGRAYSSPSLLLSTRCVCAQFQTWLTGMIVTPLSDWTRSVSQNKTRAFRSELYLRSASSFR